MYETSVTVLNPLIGEVFLLMSEMGFVTVQDLACFLLGEELLVALHHTMELGMAERKIIVAMEPSNNQGEPETHATGVGDSDMMRGDAGGNRDPVSRVEVRITPVNRALSLQRVDLHSFPDVRRVEASILANIVRTIIRQTRKP